MSKKILAGILAAASILSVSAVASAEDTSKTTTFAGDSQPDAKGVEYGVNAVVSYGSVDCVLPATSVLEKNSVVVNPYGAAVKDKDADASVPANTRFIASPYYKIENNDANNGLKVIATVSVKSATGLVIVDGQADPPIGWKTAEDKTGTKIDRSKEEVNKKKFSDFDPLLSYDKIALTYKKGEAKTPENLEKAVGGALATKQAMNTSVYLVGGTDTSKIKLGKENVADKNDLTSADTFRVDFAAKGTTGGTLLYLDKKGGTKNAGYFTTMGDLNPAIDKDNYSWGKEALSLSIVLKLIPVVEA